MTLLTKERREDPYFSEAHPTQPFAFQCSKRTAELWGAGAPSFSIHSLSAMVEGSGKRLATFLSPI